MIRKVVLYTGRVQGVGFRYTTAHLAKRFDVAGYVQNLPDGRVRLDVQGKPGQVQGLLDAVAQTMVGNIQSAEVTEQQPDSALGDPDGSGSFGIRY